jgi:hypothetical protein
MGGVPTYFADGQVTAAVGLPALGAVVGVFFGLVFNGANASWLDFVYRPPSRRRALAGTT